MHFVVEIQRIVCDRATPPIIKKLLSKKWGIKALVLADAANGHVWSWDLYTGKDDVSDPNFGLAHRAVMNPLDDDRLRL